MKQVLGIIAIVIISAGVLVGISYAFGWIGVHQTKTIGKAQQNAERGVFEESQSYVEGKRQEALRYFKEYTKATDEDKKTIEEVVALSFANFDEGKLPEELEKFINDCKYK